MNAEQSSGRENVVIPQLVFWAEKWTFFLCLFSEVQPLLSPAPVSTAGAKHG